MCVCACMHANVESVGVVCTYKLLQHVCVLLHGEFLFYVFQKIPNSSIQTMH